jgi:hypothetical protein
MIQNDAIIALAIGVVRPFCPPGEGHAQNVEEISGGKNGFPFLWLPVSAAVVDDFPSARMPAEYPSNSPARRYLDPSSPLI